MIGGYEKRCKDEGRKNKVCYGYLFWDLFLGGEWDLWMNKKDMVKNVCIVNGLWGF